MIKFNKINNNVSVLATLSEKVSDQNNIIQLNMYNFYTGFNYSWNVNVEYKERIDTVTFTLNSEFEGKEITEGQYRYEFYEVIGLTNSLVESGIGIVTDSTIVNNNYELEYDESEDDYYTIGDDLTPRPTTTTTSTTTTTTTAAPTTSTTTSTTTAAPTTSTTTSTTTPAPTTSTTTTTTTPAPTTTTTTSTTTTTTTVEPFTTVESFGADPLYTLKYDEFDVTPLPGENKSLITYTGTGSIFESDFVSRNVEFVLFNGHLNTTIGPTSGVVNGNYVPSETTSRYSYVTDYIDGKNVKVGFVYNGGNTTPVSRTNMSGYFFIDNRNALRNAFISTTRENKLVFQSGKTYVTKGGWNSEVMKRLYATSTSTGKANIKISIEDAFSMDISGENYTNNSFNTTFGSAEYFLLTNANNGIDIHIDNINILPPHYTFPSAQYINTYTYRPIFSHYYNGIGAQRASINKITNSDGYFEKATAPVVSGRQPNFIQPSFAFSNDGGVVSGGDIGQYQEFILENSNWTTIQFHNLKFNYANGNLLKLIGTTASPVNIDISDINSESERGVTFSVSIVNDSLGRKRIMRNDGRKTWYIGANQYWFGTGLGNQDSTFYSNRLQYFRVNNGGVTYSIYPPNQAAAQTVYGGAIGTSPTILNGSDLFLFEEIPFVGATISIDGSYNRKHSDTRFEIYGWGLQANTSYPAVDVNTIVETLSGGGDKLMFNGVTYSIIERKRITSTQSTASSYTPGWMITLNAGITASNPTFTVVDSKTEFMLTGTNSVTCYFYAFGGYFCYAATNGNYIFENVNSNGFGRYTDNPKNPNGSSHTWSLSSPLYLLQKYLSFKNYNHVGTEMLSQITGADGLQWRNRITGTTSNRVIIDGGRLWWSRGSTNSNIVEFRNRPTLMVGGSYGEPRIVDPITDGSGFVIEDGATFNFSNTFPSYDLSNIYLKYTGYTGLNRNYNIRLYGEGNVKIDNFTTDLLSAPDTYMGIDYSSPYSGVDWKLNLTGNNGRCGFRVGGTFSNNSIILSNWSVVKIPFAASGYSRYNSTWPASYTEVYPNFSINERTITTSTTTTTTTLAPELWTINWIATVSKTYDESIAYGILTLFTNGVPTEQYSTLDIGSGNFYLYSNNTYQFKFELIDAASGPVGDPGFFYDLNELSPDIIDVAYGNYPGVTQATINLTFPETINPFASYNLDIYGYG